MNALDATDAMFEAAIVAHTGTDEKNAPLPEYRFIAHTARPEKPAHNRKGCARATSFHETKLGKRKN